ncbi:hypothetical protein D6764_01070, partial [Candidatus Woesearchaeota archaeon]
LEMANAITSFGRHIIQETAKVVESKGFEVIYSDTDSVFLKGREGKKGGESVKEFVERVNLALPELIKLEYVGTYPAALFAEPRLKHDNEGRDERSKHKGAKKKYALLTEDGRIVVKGFESVRRNWSPIAKKVQHQVLRILLEEGSVKGREAQSLEEAREVVNTIIEDVRKRRIPNSEMIISTVLQRDLDDYDISAPHVEAAKRMRDQGFRVEKGCLVKYIVVPSGEESVSHRVRLPWEVPEGGYDAEYYVRHQILPVVEGILSTFESPQERNSNTENSTLSKQ